VTSHVRFSARAQCSPLISEGQADIVVAMEPVEALRVMTEFGNPGTRVILNARPIYPPWVLAGQAKYPPIEEILDKLGQLASKVDVVGAGSDGDRPPPANILMIGALAASGLLPIPIESYEEAMREIMAPKDVETNLDAFRQGARAMMGN